MISTETNPPGRRQFHLAEKLLLLKVKPIDMNPFDLNPARAYTTPEAFCPRPDLSAVLRRAAAGRLWTLIAGERRMGKSSAIIADCVRARRRILQVDLMGVTSAEDINERFRWAWAVFLQQDSGGIFSGLAPEISASIPGTGVEVKLGGQAGAAPQTWGDIIMAYDKRVGKAGGLLFLDEFQDLFHLPDKGQKATRSLRAALQMTKHVTLVLAGSSQHLLSTFFATSAAAFFKGMRLQHRVDPLEQGRFLQWAGAIFKQQHRGIEPAALTRLYELTDGITEDLVAVCAEIWVAETKGRSITPADVESAWRLVVSNASQFFLPHLSSLSALQAQLLRHLARNPGVQPFSDSTLRALGSGNSAVHKALARLHELELVRIEESAGRKRVWIHDPRLAFYLRT